MVSSLDGRAAVGGSSRPSAARWTCSCCSRCAAAPTRCWSGPAPCAPRATARCRARRCSCRARSTCRGRRGCSSAPGQRVLVYTRAGRAAAGRGRRSRWCRSSSSGAVLADLRARGIERLLCEGGPTLNRALLAAGLLDELFLTLSPLVTADDSQPAIVRAARCRSPRGWRCAASPPPTASCTCATACRFRRHADRGSERTRGRRRVGARRGDRAPAAAPAARTSRSPTSTPRRARRWRGELGATFVALRRHRARAGRGRRRRGRATTCASPSAARASAGPRRSPASAARTSSSRSGSRSRST